jgi:hypothetical protein
MSKLVKDAKNYEGWRDDYDVFLTKLDEKVAAGAVKYGNASFSLPVQRTLDEIELELLDICGWSFITWTRLQTLKKALG